MILHFLLSLTGSLRLKYIDHLITTTLCACPDLIIPYFGAVSLNFDPQPTSQWIHISEVVIKVSYICICVVVLYTMVGL